MKIPKLEWQTVVVLVAFVAAAVVVWTVAPDHRGDILATLAVVGPAVLAVMRPMLVPPAALLLVACLGASGCGASALRTHATIATVASIAVGGAAPLVAPACEAAMSSCQREPACLTETAERCRVASRAMDGAVAGVRGYIDAVEVASLADEGAALPALLAGWQALARLWPTVVAALAAFGVALPALPGVTP